MERIIILGCGGSGKSTLARSLGDVTGLPVVHLDRIWWRENWEHISREEFDRLLNIEAEKPRWIIDGNYSRTIPLRLEKCDTAIYLDFPRWQCLLGIFKRFLTNFGKTRPDMAPNCPEQIDREFFWWVWNFNRDNRPEILEMLNRAENTQVIVLKTRREVKRFLDECIESRKRAVSV